MSKVAVVGAGTMGHGMAQVVALAGYETVLTDSNAAVLEAAPAVLGMHFFNPVHILAIADYLHQQLKQPHYEPPGLLREKVAAGELGKKTGKGFYEWPLKN